MRLMDDPLNRFLLYISEAFSHSEQTIENEEENVYLIKGLTEDEALTITTRFIDHQFDDNKPFRILLDFGEIERRTELAYYDD